MRSLADVIGLYTGLTTLIFFAVPKTGIRFASKTFANDKIFTGESRLNTLAGGLFAGICEGLFVVTPMETIKVKLIHDKFAEKPQYRGLIHGIVNIYKELGFKGVYAGVFATTSKQATNQGIRFLVYEDVLGQLHVKPSQDLFLFGLEED